MEYFFQKMISQKLFIVNTEFVAPILSLAPTEYGMLKVYLSETAIILELTEVHTRPKIIIFQSRFLIERNQETNITISNFFPLTRC